MMNELYLELQTEEEYGYDYYLGEGVYLTPDGDFICD